MKARNTLILALAALAFGAYLVFYESKREIKEEGAPELTYLFDFNGKDVTAVEIRMAERPAVSLARKDEVWRAFSEGGKGYEAETSLADDYIETLRGIQAAGLVIEEGAVNLANYGLDDPRDRVVLYGETEGRAWEKRLLVGNETPIGSRRYVTDQDGRRVLMLDDYMMRRLDKKPSDFRPRELFSFERGRVARIEMTHHEAGKLVLEKAQTGWRVAGNEQSPVEQSKIDDLIGSLGRLRVSAFTDEEIGDGRKFGLDRPTMSYRLADSEGAELALFHVGDRQKGTSGDYYASVPVKGSEVFLLDAFLLNRLPKTLDELQPEPEEIPEVPVPAEGESAGASADTPGDAP